MMRARHLRHDLAKAESPQVTVGRPVVRQEGVAWSKPC